MSDLSPSTQEICEALAREIYGLEPADIPNKMARLRHVAAIAIRATANQINHDWSAFNCVDSLCEIAEELAGASPLANTLIKSNEQNNG
jgi:hypothetical protein